MRSLLRQASVRAKAVIVLVLPMPVLSAEVEAVVAVFMLSRLEHADCCTGAFVTEQATQECQS